MPSQPSSVRKIDLGQASRFRLLQLQGDSPFPLKLPCLPQTRQGQTWADKRSFSATCLDSRSSYSTQAPLAAVLRLPY